MSLCPVTEESASRVRLWSHGGNYTCWGLSDSYCWKLQLTESSRTLRQVSLRSLLSQMRETEASENEVTSSVDGTARTRWTEFKLEQSGSLCSENASVITAMLPLSSFSGHLWQPNWRDWIHRVRQNAANLGPARWVSLEFLDWENLNADEEPTGRISVLGRRNKDDLPYRWPSLCSSVTS